MKSIRTVIVEDEKLARELLKKYLSSFPEIDLVAECSNGFEAIKIINAEKPELIFLDIQMPKLNGFEMLELIDSPPLVIFTTAFNQYAIKAFEVNAVDYLLKPYSEERLAVAVNKAREKLSNYSQVNVNELPSNTDGTFIERIVVKDGQQIFIIPVEKIKFLEAQDDYVMIYTVEGKYLKQKTLKFYEQSLSPDDFIRIHRSYIVQVKEIKQIVLYEKDSYQVKLSDKITLPVSKTGYEKLKQIFQ